MVLIIVAKLKFKEKFKYHTRESEYNYYQQVEKISIITLSMFYAAIRVCNVFKLIEHNDINSKKIICKIIT